MLIAGCCFTISFYVAKIWDWVIADLNQQNIKMADNMVYYVLNVFKLLTGHVTVPYLPCQEMSWIIIFMYVFLVVGLFFVLNIFMILGLNGFNENKVWVNLWDTKIKLYLIIDLIQSRRFMKWLFRIDQYNLYIVTRKRGEDIDVRFPMKKNGRSFYFHIKK